MMLKCLATQCNALNVGTAQQMPGGLTAFATLGRFASNFKLLPFYIYSICKKV